MLVRENFVSGEQDCTVIISRCAKFPKIIFSQKSYLLYYLTLMVHLLLHFVGLAIHAAIFVKQKQLEKQQSGQWVVNYDKGEIRFVRKNLNTCNRKLWKNGRNVISPIGSFLSFLLSAVYGLFFTFMFNNLGPSGPSTIYQFLIFSVHSVIIFLNFVETVCSPTLRGSLLDVIPRIRLQYPVARREGHVVNV